MEILTGNELTSGATVYLAGNGNWVEDLQAARLFSQDDAEARDAGTKVFERRRRRSR